MRRPYRQAGIGVLEDTFAVSREDRQIIEALLYELEQRSTDRAGRLKAQVAHALAELEGRGRRTVPSAKVEPPSRSAVSAPAPVRDAPPPQQLRRAADIPA